LIHKTCNKKYKTNNRSATKSITLLSWARLRSMGRKHMSVAESMNHLCLSLSDFLWQLCQNTSIAKPNRSEKEINFLRQFLSGIWRVVAHVCLNCQAGVNKFTSSTELGTDICVTRQSIYQL